MRVFYKSFKKKIKSILYRFLYPDPSIKQILNLIASIRPVETEIGLVRLGGDNDGGYLVPQDLDQLEACFSPGVGKLVNFERDCAALGMKVFMADASVEDPMGKDPDFNFMKKFLGGETKDHLITLEDWMELVNVSDQADLLLQMDIEGAEYNVINSTAYKTLNQFRIIIIEFHELQKLWDGDYYHRARKTFRKLLKSHACVHIHPNNCCGININNGIEIPVVAEFTFLRKDRFKKQRNVSFFPHPLDQDNVDKESIILPRIWY